MGVCLYPFSLLKLIWKLHNISVTLKMVKKVIMNINLSKVSGPVCIPVVILLTDGATRTVALDISKAFDRVWHAGHLHKLKSMEFQVIYLALFILFLGLGGSRWKVFTRISK